MLQNQEWESFTGRLWKEECNVRDFIQNNYTPYDGDETFLEGPTEATNRLWGKVSELQKEERAKGGVLDMETDVVTGITTTANARLIKPTPQSLAHERRPDRFIAPSGKPDPHWNHY